MNANDFLEMIKTAFLNGELKNQDVLCKAIGGANHILCSLTTEQWIQSFSNTTEDWFNEWPDASYQSLCIDENKFFLGPSEAADMSTSYSVYRLLRLPKIYPDISSPDDLEEENLTSFVEENLSHRKLIFVTDWEVLNSSNCCVAEAVEVLGLGDEIFDAREKRVVASLAVNGQLHRPTWIDSGYWLYWMPNLDVDANFGYTRHLISGEKSVKEWVCRASHAKVKSTRLIHATRGVNYQRLTIPESYWNGTRTWINNCRKERT